jgi:hypothetical protein
MLQVSLAAFPVPESAPSEAVIDHLPARAYPEASEKRAGLRAHSEPRTKSRTGKQGIDCDPAVAREEAVLEEKLLAWGNPAPLAEFSYLPNLAPLYLVENGQMRRN